MVARFSSTCQSCAWGHFQVATTNFDTRPRPPQLPPCLILVVRALRLHLITLICRSLVLPLGWLALGPRADLRLPQLGLLSAVAFCQIRFANTCLRCLPKCLELFGHRFPKIISLSFEPLHAKPLGCSSNIFTDLNTRNFRAPHMVRKRPHVGSWFP